MRIRMQAWPYWDRSKGPSVPVTHFWHWPMLRKRVLEIRDPSPSHAYRLSQLEVASRVLSLIPTHGPALHAVSSTLRTGTVKTWGFLETPNPKVAASRRNKLERLDRWGWDYKLSEANLQGFTSAFRFQICFPSTHNIRVHSEFYWERLRVNLFIIKGRVGFRALGGGDVFQFPSTSGMPLQLQHEEEQLHLPFLPDKWQIAPRAEKMEEMIKVRVWNKRGIMW